MSDKDAAAKLDQGSYLPGDEDREFKSFADEGYDPGKVVPGGYDPGHVVKGHLRSQLIRAAASLPKGSEDRLALIELINGGDPASRIAEARVAAEKEAKLREEAIRLAHSLPAGSDERKAILATLKEAGCEKLPPALREQCEKKVEEGKKNDEKEKKDKKDDGKKAALVRLAATMEKGSAERKAILELAAGCEKLPEGPMRDNCEKKKEEGKKNDAKEDKKAYTLTRVEQGMIAAYREGVEAGKKGETVTASQKRDHEFMRGYRDGQKGKKAKVKTDDACMKKFQDKDGSFKGGKGAAFKNCVKGFEECATGVKDAAGLCASIGREHGKMASADAKSAAQAAFKSARAQGESTEVALLAAKVAMRIRG